MATRSARAAWCDALMVVTAGGRSDNLEIGGCRCGLSPIVVRGEFADVAATEPTEPEKGMALRQRMGGARRSALIEIKGQSKPGP